MISYSEITKLFFFDLKGKWCIEIEFLVNGCPRYQSCWMGKTPDKVNKEKDSFWYGLVPDGSEAYDFDNFHDFSTTRIHSILHPVHREIAHFSHFCIFPHNLNRIHK